MRWVFCLAVMLGTATPALAADYDLPILRGSEPPAPVVTVGPATFTRWSGFYVGGVASYNNATTDFINATQPLVAFSLRATTLEEQVHPSGIAVLGKGADSAFGGGAFLGYNTQWQDLILGVEATYTHTNLSTTATGSAVARIFPTVTDAVALNASGHLNLTDYGEARFRAGYVVGNLLPYGFMGLAVGRASYSVSTIANIAQPTNTGNPDYSCLNTGVSTPTCQFISFTNSAGQDNALLWGFSVGAGLDWALTQNFFLRGEFEFVQFAPISNINLPLVSGRVGAGYKF
ncbi:MAG: outer membrane beta-barrel protein [Xanthobacteraceae bacterium]